MRSPYTFLLLVTLYGLISCHTSRKVVDQAAEVSISPMNDEAPPVEYVIEDLDTAGKVATIVFDSTAYHYGAVQEGDRVAKEIFFTNTGPGDLLIELVTACECTQIDWTRLPVKAGQRSKLSIIYNSKGKDGPQIVDVDIIGNTDPIVTGTKFYITVNKNSK